MHNSILLKATSDEQNNTITLSWNPYRNWKGGVRQYMVYRRVDNERDYSFYRVVSASDSSVTYKNGTDGFTHYYRLLAVQENGNESKESWSNSATVNFEHPIDIPTVITPNGDGVNDTWVIKNLETYHQAEIQIFNRWGNEVYHNTGPYTGNWDGTYNGQPLPDGAYFYVIKLNQAVLGGGKESQSGTVTILR
jgi:gliding motility-associated-like protein